MAFLSSLEHYEIAIPVRVGPQGEALSPEASGGEAWYRRPRRSADNPAGSEQLYYQLTTPRTNFLLNLTLHQGLLSERFRVEYWGRGRLAWSHPYSLHCHYVGHLLNQHHTTKVALSNCNGLVGIGMTIQSLGRNKTHPDLEWPIRRLERILGMTNQETWENSQLAA